MSKRKRSGRVNDQRGLGSWQPLEVGASRGNKFAVFSHCRRRYSIRFISPPIHKQVREMQRPKRCICAAISSIFTRARRLLSNTVHRSRGHIHPDNAFRTVATDRALERDPRTQK